MSTKNPYQDTAEPGDGEALETTLMAKAERFAVDHYGQTLAWMYASTLLSMWLLSFTARVPRADLGPEQFQIHWVPVFIHGGVAAVAAFIGSLEGARMDAKVRVAILATVASVLLMVLVSTLVEVLGS